MTQAWNEISSFVSTLSIKESRDYFRFLIERVEVSFLAIPNDTDPNMIFEVLNFRGKPLDDFDLIRNHLYSYFNDPKEKSRRSTVHRHLDENLHNQLVVGTSNKVTDYARCYFQCEYGLLPKEKFYRRVRDNIRKTYRASGQDPANYAYDLVGRLANQSYIEIFKAIARSDTSTVFIDQFNSDANKGGNKRNLKIFLDELRSYSVTQPILLALLSRYIIPKPGTRARKRMATCVYSLIKKINAFVMRTALVDGKFEPSRHEAILSALAQRIHDARSVEEIAEINVWGRLKDTSSAAVLNDAAFVEALGVLKIRTIDKAKRFVFSLNAYVQSDIQALAYSKMTLEHILPKSPQHWREWTEFEEAGHELFIHRLGNLTLLSNNDNKASPKYNANWKAKRKSLESSTLIANQELLEIESWTPESIQARQREMAQLATRIWKF